MTKSFYTFLTEIFFCTLFVSKPLTEIFFSMEIEMELMGPGVERLMGPSLEISMGPGVERLIGTWCGKI